MATDEKTPLMNDCLVFRGSKDRREKPVPFARCAALGSMSTFLIIMVIYSSNPLTSQYVHARLMHQYSTNVTTYNNSSVDEETLTRVQQETSDFLMILSVITNVPAIFVNVLLGSLSDYVGRKVLFLLPTIGIILKNVLCTVIMYCNLSKDYFYLAFAMEGLGGGSCAYLVGAFTLAADITSNDRQRIVATTIVEVGIALSSCSGSLMTGFLIDSVGYKNVIALMTTFATITCMLLVFLPETRERQVNSPWSPLTHINNVFRFYTCRHREDRKVTVLYILSMFIFCFGMLTILGRSSIETLYALDKPFSWTSVEIGYFGALRLGLSNLGSLVAIKSLQGHIRLENLALLGALDSVAACILEGLATTSWMLFLVPVVGIVSSTTVPIMRGTMSRMTSPHEQGAMFAGIGFVETSVNLINHIMLTSVYSATVAYTRGAVFFLMAGFSSVATILCIVLMSVASKRDRNVTVCETKVSKNNELSSGHFTGSSSWAESSLVKTLTNSHQAWLQHGYGT